MQSVDDKQVATQKLELTLLSGGHQIRVTAPGMHPFQTEVVIKDKETRALEVALEALAPAEKPKLRVAVGCSDTEPRAPEEGLILYIDGPDVLAPTLVKRQWSDDQKKNVVQEVEYALSPGAHRVRVAITDCRPIDVNVNVDAQAVFGSDNQHTWSLRQYASGKTMGLSSPRQIREANAIPGIITISYACPSIRDSWTIPCRYDPKKAIQRERQLSR